ncbi:MAG: nucleoside kinase [Chloroflexi bacterium]|nr:nucleoside kinase [Chloroflexi bacterium CFX1]MCK6566555.1 nucleoside kinase [Anaerolineales bacterium]MCQ3954469.1 nucleoside kinase [Chloroflexota bacterium]MDL1920475.1 nucleoside kinase [Chloroflexi bacterium CFX5]NUQ60695.1 nucleoside kinase [Anaerolineales bacterium]
MIQLTPPNPNVQLHLPNGKTLTAPRGTKVGDFLSLVRDDFPAPIVAAIINNEIHELTYPIKVESNCAPVTMDTADGARIYRRSLVFLLEAAFSRCFQEGYLIVDYSVSSGGFYCEVKEREPLSQDEISALEAYMRALVKEDRAFERREAPIQEAIEYFATHGHEDKLRLLKHRRKEYLTLYTLDGHMDYMHGYMVPSTGCLQWFAFKKVDGGFIMQYPRRHAPTTLGPLGDYPKLIRAFRQYGDWLETLRIDNAGALNDAIQSGRADEIVLVSEALHEQHLSEIAQQIAEKKSRIILIAGPSSSGKTTTSRRLAVQLLARGISPYPLELDNYFVDRDATPLDENGEHDFEALEALDLKRLAGDIEQLIGGAEVQLPRYNFKTGRSEEGDAIQLRDGQPIILEGIHGMNPRLIPDHWADSAFRLYVSALTQLNLDRHNRVSTTDTRLIRRMVRDARERGYPAQATLSRWESVRRGEKRHIFPYQENADVMFNSALVYELPALKPLVEPLLRQVSHNAPEYIEARRLLAFLDWFLPLDASLIPSNSIVREFYGGSSLKDFKIWRG